MLLLTTSLTFAQEKQPLAIKQAIEQVNEPYKSMAMAKEVLVAQNSLGGTSKVREATATVNEAKVSKLFSRETQTTGGAITRNLQGDGFTYRHDWGNYKGSWKLTLNWGAINRNSRVFVSISEGDPAGGKFVGDAKYTLYNVAPSDGKVVIWLNIDWDYPLRLYADYLVVNP